MLRDGMECDEVECIGRISFPDKLPGRVLWMRIVSGFGGTECDAGGVTGA